MALCCPVRLLATLVLSAYLSPCVLAGRDSQGTEFILGYMENTQWRSDPLNDIELFITTVSNTPATVTVTTPLFDPSWSETITVSRGNIKTVKVPHQIRGVGVEKSNKGVRVQATQEVSVYSVNKEPKSTDAYVSLPVDVLGQEYYAMTYTRDAELLVVGTQDNTQVSIEWPTSAGPCSIAYGGTTYGNGDTLTLTLNKYETFHALQLDTNADFTGAYITSNKPIAVISGNKKIAVPLNAGSADHLTEMLMPVDTWGTSFISTSTPDRSIGDRFRMVASEDSTTVTFSGGVTKTMSNAGDFQEQDLSTGDYQSITSDKPIMIAMFTKTFKNDGPNNGDPAMSLLIPEPQYASDYTWSSVKDPTGQEFSNNVAVIIEKSMKAGLRLDGSPVTWQEQKDVTGSSKVHLWARVTPGSHNIFHTDPSVTFMALASGTFAVNSYAYQAGLRLAQINTVCVPSTVVAGDIIDNDCDGKVDEETLNNVDDDGDGLVDEDLATPPRVDGNWGSWGSYGSCSVSCGGSGIKTRTRACDNPAPANNGLDCPGSGSETASCNNGPCAVNGNWATWSSWGTCSVSCGGGSKSRSRTCTNPPPANGGTQCSGSGSDTSTCNTQPCPVDGGWGTWQAWSACSVSCMGVGVQARTRQCDNPAPLHGGAQCSGTPDQTQTCDKRLTLCSLDGGWSQWGAWSACTKTCGAGLRLRQRPCNSPVPKFGGALCSGDFVEKEICGNVPCSNSSSYVQTCPERYFDCASGNITCVHYLKKCDCVPNCDDASDEDPEYAGCVSDSGVCRNAAQSFLPMPTLTFFFVIVTAILTTRIMWSNADK
ncbi:uncharacterized protein LOC143301799 [Babylonia areolata]|uniref:uncharacterized protein LOC143301799 n=1 Tax=Babylonia areolata TaxID=304850 RepID=UPI003FD41477